MKTKILYAASITALLLVLFMPGISSDGAKKGLVLWAEIIVPSLLPSMILTSFLVKIHATTVISKAVWPVLSRIYKLSKEGCFCLVSAVLCGYPMGLKCVNDLLNENRIEPAEARQLTAICSYPSPMFIIGYITTDRLKCPRMLPYFLASTYLPSLVLGVLSRHMYKKVPGCVKPDKNQSISIRFEAFEDSVVSSCLIIIKVGAYMMLFSMASGWINSLRWINHTYRMYICLLLEMTTGVNAASQSDLTLYARCAACLFASSFGGLCTMAQTFSVMDNPRLNKAHYAIFKVMHGALSAATFALLLLIIPA